MIVNLEHTNDYGIITLNWNLQDSANYDGVHVYLYDDRNVRLLLATLPVTIPAFAYDIPHVERGAIIQLGVAPFAGEIEVVTRIDVASVPNQIEGLISKVSGHQVELTWTRATGKNIKGYRVVRDGVELGIAAVGRYVDIGSTYKIPISGETYVYEVFTVTYDEVLSAPSACTVHIAAINEEVRLRQLASVPIGAEAKFRICSVGDDGSRSRWTTYRKMLLQTERQPHEFQFRLRAITVDGASSLPLTSRSLVIENNFDDEKPTFRLRIVDVDGVESDAIVTETQDLVWGGKVLINRSGEKLLDKNNNTMIGRRL